MNKLLRVALKEISLIRAQKLALLLIIIYPVAVMFILGISVSGMQSFQSIKAGIVVPSGGEGEQFLNSIKSQQNINVVPHNNIEDLKKSVLEKKILVGIEVENFSNPYSSKVLNFYYDNSNIVTSRLFFSIAQAFVKSVGYESVRKILEGLFSDFRNVKQNLSGEVGKIDSITASLEELQSGINSINVEDLSSLVQNQKATIDSVNSELNELDANIAYFKHEISQVSSEINSIETIISSYSSKINDFSTKISGYENEISNQIQTIDEIINSGVDNETKQSLLAIRAKLVSVQSDLQETSTELNSIKEQLQQTKSLVEDFKERINTASLLVESARHKILEFKSLLSSSSSSINSISFKLEGISSLLDKAKQVLGTNSNEGLLLGLKDSKTVLQDFMSKLEQLNKFSPEALSQPIIVKEKPLFSLTPTSAMTPSVIAIVLLFSCILLSSLAVIIERSQGAYLRMKLSSTANSTLLYGRLLGQLAFAMLESVLILVIAFIKLPLPFPMSLPVLGQITSIGFGVTLNGSFIDLLIVLLLVSFSFIAIGILITNFTKSQATAVLSALLIMIPMLFLSGIIFPIEFMSGISAVIANIMPLTAANSLLLDVMIKGRPLLELIPQILILLIPAILIVIFTLLREEGKIEFEKLGIWDAIKDLLESGIEKGSHKIAELKSKEIEKEFSEEEGFGVKPEDFASEEQGIPEASLPEFKEFEE